MKAVARRVLAGGALAAVLVAGAAAFVTVPATRTFAQAAAATKTFASEQYRYTVALPAGCRHEEGPGTVDAVCSADFDPERSAQVSNAAALVMEVGAEVVAADAGKTARELGQTYSEAAFREEIPETVCGESDKARVKIDNIKQTIQDVRLVYGADVTCSAVKFLQIGERRASVQYLIGPDARYRLVARAPTDDFAKHKQAIDAFFDSFRVLPAGK
jgi:hypothetical protein